MVSRLFRYLGVGGALGLVLVALVLATPLGSWVLALLLERLAPTYGWRLDIGAASGSPLGTVSFGELTAARRDGKLELDLERLDLSAWSYAVSLTRPRVRVQLADPDSTPPEKPDTPVAALPVARFPELEIIDGSLLVARAADSLRVRLTGLAARYHAAGDTAGRLELSAAAWAARSRAQEWAGAGLTGRLAVEPRLLHLEELRLSARRDSLGAELEGAARLGLIAGLPTDLRARVDVRTPRDTLQVMVATSGALRPLALRAEMEAHGALDAWGPVSLAARGSMQPESMLVDTLELALLGGSIAGRAGYHAAADSLSGRLEFADLDLAQVLPGSGWAAGTLGWALNLRDQRHAVDLASRLQGLEVLPGGPFDLDLSVSHRPDQTTRVDLSAPFGHLSAAGWARPDGAYDLTLSGTVQPDRLLGTAAAPIEVRGRARPDSVQLQLNTARLPGQGAEFGPLALDLVLTQRRFLQAALALEGDQAGVHLRADLQEGRIDTLVSRLAPLALSRVTPDLEGTVRGQVHVSGPARPDQARGWAGFGLQGLAYRDWHTGPLQVHLDYEGRRAACRVDGQGLTATVSLDRLTHCRGDVRFDRAVVYRGALAGAATDSTDRVVLSGDLTWAGDIRHPRDLEAKLDLSGLAAHQGAWWLRTDGPLQLRYSGRRAVLEPLRLRTPLGRARLAGSAGADTLALVAAIDSVTPGALAANLEGEGHFHLEVGGTPERPLAAGRLELRSVAISDQLLGDLQARIELGDTLALAAALEQDRDADPELDLRLALPAGPLLSGVVDSTSGDLRLDVAVRELDLAAPLAYLLADSLDGLVSLDGKVSVPLARVGEVGSWRGLAGHVEVTQLEVEKQGVRLSLPRGGAIELADQQLGFHDLGLALQRYDRDQQGFRPAGDVRAEGKIHATEPSLLSVQLEDIDLLALGQLGTRDLPEGQLDLEIRLSGTSDEPDLEAELGVALDDLGEVRGTLLAGRGQGDLDLTWITLVGDSLHVSGRVPWRGGSLAWDAATLQAHSEGLGLLIFLDRLPQLANLDGSLSLDLAFEGLARQTQVRGWVGVADLEVAMLDVEPGYRFPTGRLQFPTEWLQLDGGRGQFTDFVGEAGDGSGRIVVSGFVDLGALDDLAYEVKVLAQNLPYNYDDIFDVPDIDLDLKLRSTDSGSLVAGTVRLSEARVDLPLIDLNAPPVPPPPPAVQDEFLEAMELDVNVDIRAMQVQNELTDLDLEGNARVYGTFYKPRFQGEMTIVEGKVFVLNQEFEFQKGRIELDRLVPTYSILDLAYNPLLLNPELDLAAVTRITPLDDEDEQEYEIVLTLQGPIQEMAPQFTSRPPLEDSDLLMVVAFGMLSPSALFDQENRGALYSAAGQLLLSRQVKKIGLDEFQLLPSGTVLGTVGLTSVRMGKHFQNPLPVWLRYEASTKEPSLGEIRLEHKLRSYLTITGTAQSEYERYGVGLGLKKDF